MESLSSWKEIASYLGVTVRTAQKWEQERGLPVRRMPGARSQVSALVADIEAWRNQADLSKDDAPEAEDSIPEMSTPPPMANRGRILWLCGVLVLALLVGGAAWSRIARPKPVPTSFRVQQKVLTIFGNRGEFLWNHTFELPILVQTKTEFDLIWFGDLYSDGHTEILFSYLEAAEGTHSVLYCFSEDGRVLWRYSPGRAIRTADEEFDPTFIVKHFAVVPTSHGNVVAVSSIHRIYYPDEVAILNARGEVQGEYWHPGHIAFMQAGEIVGQNKPLLFVAGINNSLKSATLVVLDVDKIRGASASFQSNPHYQFQAIGKAHEVARLIFPRTCINEETEAYNGIGTIVFGKQTITVGTHEGFHGEATGVSVNYEFDRSLKFHSAEASDSFRIVHRHMEAEGLLHHKVSEAELAEFQHVTYLHPSDEVK